MACAAGCLGCGSGGGCACAAGPYGNIAGLCAADEFISFVDTVGNGSFDELLAVETIHGDLGVCSNDDAVGVSDFLVGQYILGTAGSSGLNLDPAAGSLGSLLDALCCHVGMRDTGGAGGNCADAECTFCSGRSFLSAALPVSLILVIRCVNDGKESVNVFGVLQICGELLVHEQAGKFAQHIQVNVVLGVGSRDQEDQVDGLAVQGIVLNTVFDDHGCKAGLDDCIAFAVRDCETVADAGGGLFFSAVNFCAVSVQIPDLLALCHQFNHLVQRFVLFLGCAVQIDTSSVEQISDTHVFPPFTRNCCV